MSRASRELARGCHLARISACPGSRGTRDDCDQPVCRRQEGVTRQIRHSYEAGPEVRHETGATFLHLLSFVDHIEIRAQVTTRNVRDHNLTAPILVVVDGEHVVHILCRRWSCGRGRRGPRDSRHRAKYPLPDQLSRKQLGFTLAAPCKLSREALLLGSAHDHDSV